MIIQSGFLFNRQLNHQSNHQPKMKYVDFNNKSIPVGKRKVAYVKFAMSKGMEKIKAQRIANKEFGFELKCFNCGQRFIYFVGGYSVSKCPECGFYND